MMKLKKTLSIKSAKVASVGESSSQQQQRQRHAAPASESASRGDSRSIQSPAGLSTAISLPPLPYAQQHHAQGHRRSTSWDGGKGRGLPALGRADGSSKSYSGKIDDSRSLNFEDYYGSAEAGSSTRQQSPEGSPRAIQYNAWSKEKVLNERKVEDLEKELRVLHQHRPQEQAVEPGRVPAAARPQQVRRLPPAHNFGGGWYN